MELKIVITFEENGIKTLQTYTDLEKAGLAYRNLLTEKENGRYNGILEIDLVKINCPL
jgi:hypothetical protein